MPFTILIKCKHFFRHVYSPKNKLKAEPQCQCVVQTVVDLLFTFGHFLFVIVSGNIKDHKGYCYCYRYY